MDAKQYSKIEVMHSKSYKISVKINSILIKNKLAKVLPLV